MTEQINNAQETTSQTLLDVTENPSPKERKAAEKAAKKDQKKVKKETKLRESEALKAANYGWTLHKKRFGDRYDGRKLRGIQVMTKIMPYIMERRSDACNTYADSFEVTKTDAYIQEKRAAGMENFGMLHVIIAAYVRALSQRPAVNRYVSGQQIYARTQIAVVMTIKRKMSMDSPDTCIKVKFYPTDTAEEVYQKFNQVVTENAVEGEENSMDVLNRVLCYVPRLLLRGIIRILRFLDYFGILPKAICELSPFHGSMIITSMGSLGIKPIYHHIYDFGNLPIFLCYGMKRTVLEHDRKGELVKHKYVDFKAVTDERIVDGYYYASAFKLIKHYIENPAQLSEKPKEVFEDVD